MSVQPLTRPGTRKPRPLKRKNRAVVYTITRYRKGLTKAETIKLGPHCVWSDIREAGCQHCRDGQKILGVVDGLPSEDSVYGTSPGRTGRGGPVFAGYIAECARCPDTIFEGMEVVEIDGESMHVRCAERHHA